MESTAAGRAVDAATLAHAFRITASERAEHVALRTKDDEVSITWGELRERVDALAGGLASLGLGHGDALAIMLVNRPEFHVVDIAAMTLGATPFSIYQTYAPNQIQYVVEDAGARIVVTEQAYLENVLEARKDLPDLEHVIVVDGDAPEGCLRLDAVEGAGQDFDVDAALERVGPDDVLTLIYTSGTTGPPKGVQLAHRNVMAAVQGDRGPRAVPRGRARDLVAAGRAHRRALAHHYLPIVYGFEVTCCPNPREIIAYLPEVHPQWFFAVPRIWEKIKAGLETMLAGLPSEQPRRPRARWTPSLRKVRLEQAGEEVPEELAAAVAEGRRGAVQRAARARSGSTSSWPSTSARRPRRSRSSSSSTPSASRSASCGGCPRPAAPGPATHPTGSRSAPSAPPTPGSSSSWPTTASC